MSMGQDSHIYALNNQYLKFYNMKNFPSNYTNLSIKLFDMIQG